MLFVCPEIANLTCLNLSFGHSFEITLPHYMVIITVDFLTLVRLIRLRIVTNQYFPLVITSVKLIFLLWNFTRLTIFKLD